MAYVAVTRLAGGDDALADGVRRCVELTGGLDDLVQPGSRVLLKPNVVAPVARGVTNFVILQTLIEMVRDAGATPFIGDCAGMEFHSDKTFQLLGFKEFAREHDVELVNFDHDETVDCPVRFGCGLVRHLAMPKSAMDADAVINLPRLKRHNLTTVTLGVKNLMGVAAKSARRRIHVFGLHKGVAWLAKLLPPQLTLIDGTTLVERPVFGRAVPLNILIASRNVLAADHVACRFLDVDPRRVPHLRHAQRLGVGDGSVHLVGDPIRQTPPTGGRVALKRRLLRTAYRFTFTADLVYNKLTGRTLLPSAHIRLGSHPVLDRELCDRCGRCVEVCPVDAIDLEKLRILYDRCKEVRCMRCFEACTRKAIRIKGLQRVEMGGEDETDITEMVNEE
jgi:uncharacterized protein (DUF362 family)/ferredoxin